MTSSLTVWTVDVVYGVRGTAYATPNFALCVRHRDPCSEVKCPWGGVAGGLGRALLHELADTVGVHVSARDDCGRHSMQQPAHMRERGDADIGSKTNIGAGTITCNYDGTNKHKTTIGEESFIGTNSSLVAPVNIGKGAYVGAGSVITKDVPDEALAVARGKQVIKEDWAKNKK